MDEETYAKFIENENTMHALGGPGTVEEVALTVAFLVSGAASFIKVHTTAVNGVLSIMCRR